MIEAVENHMPQVIIIDEIGTELEALAARTIAEKGVQLVGTTHGNCLENLIKNPPLTDLIGGIQYVTLSDDEAKRRKTQKSILERKSYPAFQIAIEINEQNLWTIHENVTNSIDLLLRGNYAITQTRQFIRNEKTLIKYNNIQTSTRFKNSTTTQKFSLLEQKSWESINSQKIINSQRIKQKKLVIYSYSLSYNLLKEVISKFNIDIMLTKEIKKASLIIGLKSHLQQNKKLQKIAKQKNIPIYGVNRNSIYQIAKLIQFIML
jgi:hypothetical protein